MFELIRPTYFFALTYAQKIVEAVPDEQLCGQPVPGVVMNHPAFLLGHLAWAKSNGLVLLGGQPLFSELKELHGIGSKPQPDRSVYQSKTALLEMLQKSHTALWEAVEKATPEMLAQPSPEQMRSRFPTIGNLMVGLMTTHFGSHLGQMSAWRRAMGFPSVF